MRELVMKVEGMVCSGCENRIQNALKDLESVKGVVADYTTNTVTVSLDDMELEGQIKEVIEDLGFDVIEED